jgi:hypothetical protein
MRNRIVCIRSTELSELALQSAAANWHTRGRESVKNALADPDEETVMMTSYCVRPDSIHCLTARGIFSPTCELDHEERARVPGTDALKRSQRFFDWVASNAGADGIEAWAEVYYLAADPESERINGDHVFRFFWRGHSGENGSHRAVSAGLEMDSPLAATPAQRAAFFEEVLRTLSLQGSLGVTVRSGKVEFSAKAPWHVYPLPTDFPGHRDPFDMRIYPFNDSVELQRCAAKLLSATNHKVVAMNLMVDAPMAVHNRLCESFPADYQGFEMSAFGCPSDALQAWFAGDIKSRPPGRIPVGRGWEGDPNKGFSYSVSVVETPDGPCIELGSDTATHQQLMACSKYFDGLLFKPV